MDSIWDNCCSAMESELCPGRSEGLRYDRLRLNRKGRAVAVVAGMSLMFSGCSSNGLASTSKTRESVRKSQTQRHRTESVVTTTIPIKYRRSSDGFLASALQYMVGSTRAEVLKNRYLDLPLSVYWVSDRASSAPLGTILAEVVGWNPVFVPSESPFSSEVSGLVTKHRGLLVTPGTEVGLTIAGGPENVRVPSVIGLSKDSAAHDMARRGLIPKQQDACSPTRPTDSILIESPPPGTFVAPGSDITILVDDAC
jgi:hypothetical protein